MIYEYYLLYFLIIFEEYKKAGVLHSPDTKVEEQYWGHKEFSAVDNYRNLLTFYEEI